MGSNSKLISLWDLKDIFVPQIVPKRICIEGMKHNIPCVKFSPCGEFLAACSIDKTVRIFTVPDGKILGKIDLKNWVWSINWVKKEYTINGCEYIDLDYEKKN